MPLTKLQIAPGIDKQNTEYGAEGRWVDSDNIRFRYGQPEKIGGWAKVTSDALLGSTRAILTWSSLEGVNYAMYGTNKKLYAYSEGSYGDITPTRGTGSITEFGTTNASTTVTVTDADHGCLIGDHVTISSVSGNIGGITQANLQNEFEIQTAVDDNTYTIVSPAAASSTTTGATATATYEINSGPATSIYGYGWGASVWDSTGDSDKGTWNNTREGLTGAQAQKLKSEKWSLDTWGEDVLIQKFDGGIYYWDTSSGLSSNVAATTSVSAGPTKSRFMMVSGDDRHVICFGTETTIATTTTQDNMFIRWSDQEEVNTWTPTATNTAGSQRLTAGNKINAAVRSRGAILVFTDTALYQMQFIGPPFTFGFKQLGSNCGAVGINSAIDISGKSYWMGTDSFFTFDGATKNVFEKIRRQSKFEQILKNCESINKYAKNNNRNVTKAWCCLQKDNYHEFFEIIKICSKIGFNQIVFSLDLHGSGNSQFYNENLGKSVLNKMNREKLEQAIKFGNKNNIKVEYWSISEKFNNNNICHWPFERFYISSDLRIVYREVLLETLITIGGLDSLLETNENSLPFSEIPCREPVNSRKPFRLLLIISISKSELVILKSVSPETKEIR